MKHHTFRVNCGFVMQYTFEETEIGPQGEPTEEAVADLEEELEEELEEYLHQNYGVDLVDVEVEMLLGVSDDSDA